MLRYSSADLKHIKQVVTMEQVLRHYNLLDSLTLRGQSHRGMCPFCGAGEHLPFSVSLEKHCFQCFLCRASGNVLDFVAKREDLPDIYRAAERIVEVFDVKLSDQNSGREFRKTSDERAQANEASFPSRNEPLTFTLKNIDSCHGTVQALSADVIESFGVGYYTGKGLLHNHIVVSLKNKDAEIIAYIGYDPEARSYTYPPRFNGTSRVFSSWGREEGNAVFPRRRSGRNRSAVVPHSVLFCAARSLRAREGYAHRSHHGSRNKSPHPAIVVCPLIT